MSENCREEYSHVKRKVINAVDEAVRGSSWAPPDGEVAVLTDCVVIMGWTDLEGNNVQTNLLCGSSWAAEGLVSQVLRELVRAGTCTCEEE